MPEINGNPTLSEYGVSMGAQSPSAPAWAQVLDDLVSYLPSSLARACLAGMPLNNVQPYLEHLEALLKTISTYLPRQVVIRLMHYPQRGHVEGDFTIGTVMFADISGFTSMSEKLAQLGKAGAEEIAAIVNRFFQPYWRSQPGMAAICSSSVAMRCSSFLAGSSMRIVPVRLRYRCKPRWCVFPELSPRRASFVCR